MLLNVTRIINANNADKNITNGERCFGGTEEHFCRVQITVILNLDEAIPNSRRNIFFYAAHNSDSLILQ